LLKLGGTISARLTVQPAAGAGFRGETLEEQNAQAKDLNYKQVG